MNSEILTNISSIISAGFQDFGSLHPILVHLPIGLLFIAPLFLIFGFFAKKYKKPILSCTLILLVIGTLTLLFAFESGEKAAEALEHLKPETLNTLEQHMLSAESLRLNFLILTLVFAAYFLGAEKFKQSLHPLLLIIFLLFYGYALLLLINTAHYGGKLVHLYGIKSSLYK